jgi:bifunctional DNA-binding transcriptional regulator/antitoxin component of YhaV-PrlF toxin-antitoxin module
MNEIVITLKEGRKTHDLVLPSAVPFAQLVAIFADLHFVSLETLPAKGDRFAITGRINDEIIVRPHETLEAVKAKDGDVLELVQTKKGTQVIEKLNRASNQTPFLKSLDTGKPFKLRGNQTTIGRSRKNAICLAGVPKSQIVSNEHAIIIKRNGEYWIEDKRSRNGTLIDGVLLQNNRMQIRHESRIQFGKDGPVFYFGC